MLDMEKVILTQGLFKDSEQKGKTYLVVLDLDRLIAPCYEAAGQKPKAKRYGGWEEKEIAGHSIGHWLSAAAMMYKVTGDQILKDKLEYAVDELAHVQSFDTSGYVSGFNRACFDEVFSGDFRVGHFELGGSWVPWYSLHKIFAGLIDAYQLADCQKARLVLEKLSDWADKGLAKLTDQQFQHMLICEFGGMNEVFADVYTITGDKRFLNLAERFNDLRILSPLLNEVDDLAGKHANTQIPKVIGVARLYDVTEKEEYQKIARFFWEQVIHHHSYVIGGNSNAEHFGPVDTEPLGILTTETCNTYNMLKLTEYLFAWSPDSRYMDYYENALFNHILASQDPESGMKTYFISTEPGHFKVYCTPDQSFWCCTGSGMENPARYAKNIYTRIDDKIYVNLFIASEFTLANQIKLKQETQFPYQQKSKLLVTEANGATHTILIRVPYWLTGEMNVSINGENVEAHVEHGYLKLTRHWHQGDCITWDLPMSLHTYTAKDNPHHKAFLYGPIVLAGKLGHDRFPETDIVADHLVYNNYPLIDVPTLVTTEEPSAWLELTDPATLTFTSRPIGEPGQKSVTMIPFYRLHHERYTIYWQVMSEQDYQSYQQDADQKAKKLRSMTVDYVQPGEQQPEIEHDIQAKQSSTGYLNLVDRHYRDARDGGYFSYQLAVEAEQANTLIVTYYGNDQEIFIDGKSYPRQFNILVDQACIATETLTGTNPKQLVDQAYPIPQSLTNGKNSVHVCFEAPEGKIAGGVYGVRVIRN